MKWTITRKGQLHHKGLTPTHFLQLLLLAAIGLTSLNFYILLNDTELSAPPVGRNKIAAATESSEAKKSATMFTSLVTDSPLISRVWHGWTTKANADRFETLLREQVLPGFTKSKIKGYKGCQLLRRELKDEVEFTTIMWFDSIESVKGFAGEDYETAHIDPSVRAFFTRYDAKSVHAEVRYAAVVQ